MFPPSRAGVGREERLKTEIEVYLYFWDSPEFDLEEKFSIMFYPLKGKPDDALIAFSRVRLPEIKPIRWLEF